jgi:hypothetical protein
LSAYLSAQQQQQQSAPQRSAAGVGQSQDGCRRHRAHENGAEARPSGTTSTVGAPEVQCKASVPAKQAWRPLLLIIPLRLGLSKISAVYYNGLKVLFNVTLHFICRHFVYPE